MTNPTAPTRTLVVEKEMPHPPEKIWRALTQASLIEAWLLANDFKPVVGHQFALRNKPMPHWDGVIDCEVLIVEPYHRLSYSWNALGLKSVVTWTLTPSNGGTHIRMEQSGFRSEVDANYKGASYGWQKFIGSLEHVVEGLD
jgi:uncharacterized protein YndB with AHSA1/START domain